MKKYITFIIIGFILLLTGCSKPLTSEAKIGQTFLESKGYKVISYEGNTENYTLSNSSVASNQLAKSQISCKVKFRENPP